MSRGRASVPVHSILVPVDGSASSGRAVRIAAEMARAFGAELTLLHVVPLAQFPALIAETDESRETDEAQLLLAEETKLARSLGTQPLAKIRRGRVADQILRYAAAHPPDLIVMGTRGLTGAKSVLLGSVSKAISSRAKAQVVLIR